MEEYLLNKNAFTIKELSKVFITKSIDERIPTMKEFEEHVAVARGTIQNSIKFLESEGAIKIKTRGHLGSFLVDKNLDKLLKFSGFYYLVGVMPLPYSKRYEGLATGIIKTLENGISIPTNLAYMNGAKKRISMVINHRYDFTIVSKYTALKIIEEGAKVRIVKELGENSYLSSHVLLFHNDMKHEIEHDMRVGIDVDSIDQENITRMVCGDKKVAYVRLSYNQIIEKLLNNEIDAAIWNADELRIKSNKINYVNVRMDNRDDTNAVILIEDGRNELAYLLEKYLDVDVVKAIQNAVLDNELIPNF